MRSEIHGGGGQTMKCFEGDEENLVLNMKTNR